VGLLSKREQDFLEVLYVGRWMTGQEILADANVERAAAGLVGAVPEGSLYPTLFRLEEDGFLEMQELEKEGRRGRPGRRYRITAKGQRATEAVRAAGAVLGMVRV
jgi:DNA-binding PadR family transcriptional regulator